MKAKLCANCITIISLLILSIFICNANADNLPTVYPQVPSINANNHILIDHNSGQVLSEHKAYERIEPASLTKMMTIYVIDNEIKQDRIKHSDLVTISNRAKATPGTRMFVEAGTQVKAIDLMRGIIIQSGNDAAVAMAEHIAGSEDAFVNLMNQYAKKLGMKDSNFVNVSGLPDKNHYTTAYDISLLSNALIKDFPETYKIYSEKEFSHNNISQNNRNRLLWRNNMVDGIKTGITSAAGYCISASAKKGSMRLIAVVMGARTDEIRHNETNKLLVWGFRFFETYKVYEGKTELKKIKVWSGADKSVSVGLKDDVFVTIPQGQYKNLDATIEVNKSIKAPFISGIEVGNYKIKLNGKILAQQPLYTLNSVNLGNLWQRTLDNIVFQAEKITDKFIS